MNLPAGERELSERLSQLDDLARIPEAANTTPVYLVGGSVRDLLLGTPRVDLDVVVEGSAEELAERLGGAEAVHERFGTATVRLGGLAVDLATARAETYPQPGALPSVRPADLEADLARRDFTINAMAIPLTGETRLIDPHGGRGDLDAGLIRVLHPASFVDDPTRALRAARYAARLSFSLESRTAQIVREADLETVSADRVDAEMLRICAEPAAAAALALLEGWGLLELAPRAPERVEAVRELLSAPPWRGEADVALSVYAAAVGHAPGQAGGLRELGSTADRLAAERPARPSEAVALATAHGAVELVLARAAGAAWLDDYVTTWRDVALEISGDDLLATGVPQGPALGRGLEVALAAKLDGEIDGREAELATAIAAAGGS